MRKSIITVLLIFVLTLSYPVFACAGQNDNQAPEDAREEAAYQIIKVEKDFSWDSVPGFLINNVLWTEDYGIRGSVPVVSFAMMKRICMFIFILQRKRSVLKIQLRFLLFGKIAASNSSL